MARFRRACCRSFPLCLLLDSRDARARGCVADGRKKTPGMAGGFGTPSLPSLWRLLSNRLAGQEVSASGDHRSGRMSRVHRASNSAIDTGVECCDAPLWIDLLVLALTHWRALASNMPSMNRPESDQNVATLVSTAMHDLIDAMQAVCVRLLDSSNPLTLDSYEKLGLQVASMLAAAEALCRAADTLLVDATPKGLRSASKTLYAELAQELVEIGRLANVMLEPNLQQVQAHAQALALIRRLSAGAASVSSKLS